MQIRLLLILAPLLLAACTLQPSKDTIVPPPTLHTVDRPATPGSNEQEESPVAMTLAAEAPPALYQDGQLCFHIEVPADWATDGALGGFASFASTASQESFRITNSDMGNDPTLEKALAELQRGSQGPHVQTVQNFTIGNQPALWITLAPETDFTFVALVIAPDCGAGKHSLFISASRADQKQFQQFLSRLHFAAK